MFETFVKIADINIKFITKYSVYHICKEYQIDPCENADISVSVSEEETLKEMMSIPEDIRVYPAYYESVCLYRNLCKQLWKHNALILHAATFCVNERGIAFAAKSGTGKTTHLRLWQDLLGEQLKIINGDKPIVRFLDNTPIAFGTPWRGKESLGSNISSPLTDICFIQRSKTNSVSKISKDDIFNSFFNQTILPDDPLGASLTLGMISELLSKCNLWLIKCNMEPEAAKIAYDTIIKNQGVKYDTNL